MYDALVLVNVGVEPALAEAAAAAAREAGYARAAEIPPLINGGIEGNDPSRTIVVHESALRALYRTLVEAGQDARCLAQVGIACPTCGRFVPYHERVGGFGGTKPCEWCCRAD